MPDRTLADDGKRLDALDVVYHGVLYIKGRESEGGEGKIFCRAGGWRIIFEGPGPSFWEGPEATFGVVFFDVVF